MLKPFLFLLVMVGVLGCKTEVSLSETYKLYVGTYTDQSSEGIYSLAFDARSGELTDLQLEATLRNPSFVKLGKDDELLYAVQEVDDFDTLGGAVTVFRLSNEGLVEIASKGSLGGHPCHISLSAMGDKLAVSNYTGGNVCVIQLKQDGTFADQSWMIDHKNMDSGKIAHAHASMFVEEQILVADLGLDQVRRYNFQNGSYESSAMQEAIYLPSGAGPRHFELSVNGKFLYVINELNSTVSVFKKNENDQFEEIQSLSALADDFSAESFCADIHLSRDGRFLYGSNRGENSIVVFAVDNDGKLSVQGRSSVHGNWPRNFAIDPTGKYLLVANQKSDNVCVFRRDEKDGGLTFLQEVFLSRPVCLEFADS